MQHRICVLPAQQNIVAEHGANLLEVLRSAGFAVDAPCGGQGKCGKCSVLLDGAEVSACRTVVDRDMTVTLPASKMQFADRSSTYEAGETDGKLLLAFDIGTTTVAGYLLEEKTGRELGSESILNPQTVFGADVISRIRHALDGQAEVLTGCVRKSLEVLTDTLCRRAGAKPEQIRVVSIVGNPAMQQLFFGIGVENLARIPFAPALTEPRIVPAGEYLKIWSNAKLLIVPDISGYVGADTVACVLSSGLDRQEKVTLLVDIGTNGEMVLGSKERMTACSTAAGPALEGANIGCGMRGQTGAIDHVWLRGGKLECSVIGGGEAVGICGSGLIDALAAALDADLLDERGRILNEERLIRLTDRVALTQEDIRQVQMAKGAIAAGIELMAEHLGVSLDDIGQVYLAGAFGSFMDPDSACRIGLLPPVLKGRITALGNAAGSGAKLLACDAGELEYAGVLARQIEFIELAAVPNFRRSFAKNMRF